jgi:membrane protease YdiL (CAAX protease family)
MAPTAEEKPRRALPEWLQVPWRARDLWLFAAGWLGIPVVVVLGLRELAPYVPAVAQFLKSAANETNVYSLFALDLLDAVAGFGMVAFFLRRYKVGWSAAGWRRVNPARAVWYLFCGALLFYGSFYLLSELIIHLIPAYNANQPQSNEFIGQVTSHRTITLVALVFLPPVLEETIFRGFMFPAFAKRTGVVWGAIISSAIFGIAHLQPNLFVYTFPLGLVLCWMYTRLGSTIPGMFLHMLNNYVAFWALSQK